MKKNNDNRQRVVALLARKEIEFLEKLGLDSLYSTGNKLTRVEILSALVDSAIKLGISASGIKSKEEFVQRIIGAFSAYRDRRKYPRLEKNLRVAFRAMDSMEPYEKGITFDIGIGGFRIDVPSSGEHFATGQILEITIEDSEENQKEIKLIGKIEWLKENENKDKLEIGIMLTYIRDEDKEGFIKYLTKTAEVENEDSR